jgi:hypothetical protein
MASGGREERRGSLDDVESIPLQPSSAPTPVIKFRPVAIITESYHKEHAINVDVDMEVDDGHIGRACSVWVNGTSLFICLSLSFLPDLAVFASVRLYTLFFTYTLPAMASNGWTLP